MGKTPRKFVMPTKIQVSDKDPETIFRDLKVNSSQVKNLWSQQADVLRSYYNQARDKGDVALELPTGTGKTLIGLLIAEYRRRIKQERVVYLCPTKQLAYQVHCKAQDYGIPTVVLVGQQSKYSQVDFADFITSKAIAITTYSAIFNTNPRIDNAQAIIFDDAHSAESHIASLWTVKIFRKECFQVYNSIINLFKEDIPDYLYSRLMKADYDYFMKSYDVVPYPNYYNKIPQLSEYIEANIINCDKAKYAWSKIKENLEACHVYISWGEINIRPIIPPALTHYPFAYAKQRIYMSATLGDGGELERLTGVKEIERLPIPIGWEKYSSGRRLILFPDRKFDSSKSLEIAFKAIEKHGRALVLCPDTHSADFFKEQFHKSYHTIPIMDSYDIEESLDPFIQEERAVLILTRYDGIDLSGDTCRLLVVFKLPEATNLQEGFFWNRLSANALLNDRIRTRITQALGRCTRSSDDFSNVLMVGSDLLKFCAIKENLKNFHPEIQAEIAFGLANSEPFDTSDDLLGFMEDFINDKVFFQEINLAITGLRDDTEKVVKPATAQLMKSVKSELEYVTALWKNDIDMAQQMAKAVTDALSGGKELAGYRAWWFYLAGSCGYLGYRRNLMDLSVAKQNYSTALQTTNSLTWLADLAKYVPSNSEIVTTDSDLVTQAEAIEDVLTGLSIVGPKFEKKMTEFMEKISNNNSGNFEKGLEKLGEYLGFQSKKPPSEGAPDGIWVLRNNAYGFEAKSEEDSKNPISLSTCRQANGHRNWISDDETFPQQLSIKIVLLDHKERLHPDALPQVHELFHQNITEIRDLALRVTNSLRRIRSIMAKDGESNLFTKEHICEVLCSERLSYKHVNEILTTNKLDEMEISR
ncbi:DEAD/DEAH box helicase [Desulfosporosinus sp. Sb-LF]|uniref:DEAD/DEAH box helicase n=1 Tax=Desulfosporosinus sp. Sb-LF TaxID=2560027 RepID=UPI00107F1CED|nr:DEAD/DEAH box helicase [Desulfosporosinus sp. Sb-LF]TGE31448.1 DEAD/DEAH box helicase [Desulfosporosinus sp. Sb-LF]